MSARFLPIQLYKPVIIGTRPLKIISGGIDEGIGMGLMCSWVAIRTSAKAEVLDYLGKIETGVLVEPQSRQSKMSVHQSNNGWLFVFANDFGWASAERGLDLSRFGLTLAIQTEDKVEMACVVRAAENGQALWSVSHVNKPGKLLEVTGSPPDGFEAIRRHYEQMDAAEDGSGDYLHNIPVELARHISGYNVYEDPVDFVALAPARGGGTSGKGRQGFMARIGALFRKS